MLPAEIVRLLIHFLPLPLSKNTGFRLWGFWNIVPASWHTLYLNMNDRASDVMRSGFNAAENGLYILYNVIYFVLYIVVLAGFVYCIWNHYIQKRKITTRMTMDPTQMK